jgi:ABC-type multidrug transport system fused ATPase/permease subunit
MNRNMLRAPLIKSASLLAVITLLVYLTATSPEGSIWNSLATLFMATVRVAQLSLGLILALFFCLAVLTGIFLGGVAFVSRQSAARMADHLRRDISGKLLFVRSLVVRDDSPGREQALQEHGSGMGKAMLAAMGDELAGLRAGQNSIEGKIERLTRRLEHVEQGEGIASLVDRGQAQEESIQSLAAGIEKIRDRMAALQEDMAGFRQQA